MKTKERYEPRSSSSCAACKLLKRRCTPNCIFAPHFRADEPNTFAKVHKVFGASNVSKILNEVPVEHREDTVSSLTYEAEARLCDPVYGCVGAIALLQKRMAELQHDLALARARLARCPAYPSNNSIGDNNSNSNDLCTPAFGVVHNHNALGGINGILRNGHVHNMPIGNGLRSELRQSESMSSQYSHNNSNGDDDCDFGRVPILPL